MREVDWGSLWRNTINSAALVGVVLVLLQLRQNAELLELQILNQEANNFVESEMAMVGDDFADVWAKMIEEPENLELGEVRALETNLWAHDIVRWRNLYDLYERGLLDEASWKRIVRDDVRFELAHPYGRVFWEGVRTNSGIPEPLVRFIDERLAEAPFNTGTQMYEHRMNRVRELLDDENVAIDRHGSTPAPEHSSR